MFEPNMHTTAAWGPAEVWQEMLTRINMLTMGAATVYGERNSVLC